MKAYLALLAAAVVLVGCAPSQVGRSASGATASPTATAPAVPTTTGTATTGTAATGTAATGTAATRTAAPSSDPEPFVSPVACAYPSAGVPENVMVRDVFHAGSSAIDACVDSGERNAYQEFLPDPCGHDLGDHTSSVVARRAIEVMFDDNPANVDAETSMYRHIVTAYRDDAAASAYLSSLRPASRDCPERTLEHSMWRYSITSSTAQGIELSVRRTYGQPETVPRQATFRISVIRSGARVSVLTDVGWEGNPTYPAAVIALVHAAADQL